MAAGIGSRLKPFTDTMPKAMVTVAGKPMIMHVVERLVSFGIKDFVVNIHHFAGTLKDYLSEALPGNINLTFSDESDSLLDTGGALKRAKSYFYEEEFFMIHNADVWTTLDPIALAMYHQRSGGVATLAVRNRESSRKLVFDNSFHLSGWEDVKAKKKNIVKEISGPVMNLAFSGVQIVRPVIFKYFPEHDCFPLVELYLNAAGAGEVISGFVHDDDDWFDLGTPEKIEKLERTLSGLV